MPLLSQATTWVRKESEKLAADPIKIKTVPVSLYPVMDVRNCFKEDAFGAYYDAQCNENQTTEDSMLVDEENELDAEENISRSDGSHDNIAQVNNVDNTITTVTVDTNVHDSDNDDIVKDL